MTESGDNATAPPLNYAVLVRDQSIRSDDLVPPWHVLYANGDLASARAKAEAWAHENPGQQATVVQYVDHVQIVPQAKWARP